MCVVSMVMDHYKDRFPQEWITPDAQPWQIPMPGGGTVTGTTLTLTQAPSDEMRKMVEEMRGLIKEFRAAVEAAKTVDRLTGQPDCEDPEKTRLEERVAQLERRLTELEGQKARKYPQVVGRRKLS